MFCGTKVGICLLDFLVVALRSHALSPFFFWHGTKGVSGDISGGVDGT